MKTKSRRGLLLSIGIVALPAFGQGLTLFQDDGFDAAARTPGTPQLVLKGIYRLGDTYHLSVQFGDVVHSITWQQSQASAPVFNGYQIQVVDSRNVTLGLPPGISCQTNAPSGGTCLGRNQMSLTFAQPAPVSSERPPNLGSDSNPGSGGRSPGQQNDERWNPQMTSNGSAVPAPFGAAQSSDVPERLAVETGFRGRGAGRGNNGNIGGTGGRGARGSFDGGNAGGFPGGTEGDGTGGRGGGGSGNGQ